MHLHIYTHAYGGVAVVKKGVILYTIIYISPCQVIILKAGFLYFLDSIYLE